jgi:calcineurin-like phosphoesterase family protein
MKNVFLIADLHFGDSDMVTLVKEDGHPIRPFKSVEEHDATLIENWNKVVTHPSDKVYVLGDVAQKKKDIENFGKLNGKKILIKGNHDIYEMKEYAKYFKDIRATHRLDNGILMSHIPVHPSTFGKAHKVNVHGHIHDKRVKYAVDTLGTWDFTNSDKLIWNGNIDKRYFCVSVEHINYTPVELGAIELEVFGFDNRTKVLDELTTQAQELNMGY